ncbi:MAG: hypothetical protein QOG68_2565, partial [Solirubrobacteraceae bacterium]|nr:hypothetical protein [Solirubrobacteraceae bacterium]
MTRLRRIIRQEEGIAMVIAMGVLSVMLVITATVVGSAQLLGKSTTTESARKKAFEAAEAGLQATVYRLNMLAPTIDKCIGGAGETLQVPTGTACPSYTESLGNNSSFTSWTTLPLSSGGACAGLQVGTPSSISERCITSAGTVDGITRRVQTRVASYAAAPIFPLAGVVGLQSVVITNNAHVVGGTGSNGLVTINNNGTSGSVTLGPAAPNPSVGNNGVSGPITRRPASLGPFAFAPVDPGNSATVSDDIRLTHAFASPQVSPFDSIGSG